MKRLVRQEPACRFLASALIVSAALTVAGSASAQTAYIATSPNGTGLVGVSVIDTTSEKLTGKITVAGAAYRTAVSPDGTKILVTDTVANAISVIDIASRTVLARIPVSYPGQIAVTPDGSKAYLTTGSDEVVVLDLARYTITKRIKFVLDAYLAASPDGTKVYVSDSSNTVAVIDTASDSIVDKINIPSTRSGVAYPLDIAFLPDSSKAYIANYQNNNVSVVDTKTNKILTAIPTGEEPDSIAVAPDGKTIYIAQSQAQRISAVDAATNHVTAQLRITHPYGIALTPDGKTAYVTSDKLMIVVDVATLKVLKRIPMGGQPDIFAATIGPAPSPLTATTFPAAGAVATGSTAQTRAVLTNGGQSDLSNCRVEITDPAAHGVQMFYRAIDSKGKPQAGIDRPVTIAKQSEQAFRLVLSGKTAGTGGPIPLVFTCDGVTRAPLVTDFNTFDLALTASAPANIVALRPAPGSSISVPINGSNAFQVATTDIGSGDLLTVSADSGEALLPVSLTVCPTKPGTTTCTAAAAKAVSATFAAKANQSFAVFIRAADYIAPAPTASRIFVRFKDKNGNLRGLTSIAVQTPPVDPKNPPIPGPTYSGSFSSSNTFDTQDCGYQDSYSGTVKISFSPGSLTGTASVDGTVTTTLISNGNNCGVGSRSDSLKSSAPITRSGASIVWTTVAHDPEGSVYVSNFTGTIGSGKITGILAQRSSDTPTGFDPGTKISVTLPVSH